MASETSKAEMNFDYLGERLDLLRSEGRLRQLVERSATGTRIVESDGREYVNFGGNDYLGLAAERSASPLSIGSTASALVCGWTPLHQQLADRIAQLKGTESAVLFPSGFAGCSGTIATMAEEGDLILSDELNHASLIDGCRLSRAECVVYPHRGVRAVEQLLKTKRSQFNRVWLVTDSVFSMDGHVAPLRSLCKLAKRHDATMIVDEAHATGVLGETGSGLCEALGVKDQVAIQIGTLSKAIGCQGGFVAAPKLVVDYLINRCRTLIYSTALAPPAVQAGIDALDSIRDEPQRREHVQAMSRLIRERLSIDTDAIENGVPIIPVLVGSDAKAVELSAALSEQGFFVPAIRPPTVPVETARLRISVSAAHDQETVESLLKALEDLLQSK